MYKRQHIFSGVLNNTGETVELSSNATCNTPPITASATYDDGDGGDEDGNSQYFSISSPSTFLFADPPTPGTGDCIPCSDMVDLVCAEPQIAVDKDDNDDLDDL